ncbi:MAG: glucokinase [Proteobacteria bacterium]|nr:glucokinase [Pseudomonadota bacterium]MBU1641685.1 glucokinase [Pseudomonadota bacterium]
MSILLVADIGGTKIDFALVDSGRPDFVPVQQGQLKSDRFDSCEEVIAACLAGFSGQVEFASLAVAGPVVDQQVTFTNLPWQTGAPALKKKFGFAGVVLANDLVGLAEGVELLGEQDVRVIEPGKKGIRHGSLVVAPGTGLGVAVIRKDGTLSRVQATEAGHLSFAPCTEVEQQLLSFLRRKCGHVSFEMVCSGPGLGNIFSFLRSTGLPVPAELATKIEQGHELAPLLAGRALAKDIDCPISSKTFEVFFDILAEFCGNVALAFLPGDALYLGGGMLPRLGGLFDQKRFCRRFGDRGKMQDLVAALPIFLIIHRHPVLLGTYRIGRRSFYDAE